MPTADYYKLHKEELMEYNKKWRQDNKEEFEGWRKRWTKKNPLYNSLHNYRAASKLKGFPCTIDLDYLMSLDRPEVCPVLGIKIDNNNKEFKLSLDKKVPELGYVKGNVAYISMRANRLKNDATLAELKLIIKYMEGN
jgi:hypothetical protein